MSQYLNFYLKPKTGEPIYLTSYSRSTDLYDVLTDNVPISYNTDRTTDITAADLRKIINAVKVRITQLKEMAANRRKAIIGAPNADIAREILLDADSFTERANELQQVTDELSHLLWVVESCCGDICAEFTQLSANIG
jgi:hypothetical protein